MHDWKYDGAIDRYDVSGDVDLGLGTVRVHDIFDPTPGFMLDADFVFCDPPANKALFSGFYTKAEKERRGSYDEFLDRLFEVIAEIGPHDCVVEVFKSNREDVFARMRRMFEHFRVIASKYYNRDKNRCWLIWGSNGEIPALSDELLGIDEEAAIARICSEAEFDKIADPLMGKGLVAFYASKNGRRFAGTELNPKRLAVCVERVRTGSRGKVA